VEDNQFFMQQTGDPARSQQMTIQGLADLRQQQAASLAYFDVFWLCAVLAVALVFLVLLCTAPLKSDHQSRGSFVRPITAIVA
jgi:hypothetical protein